MSKCDLKVSVVSQETASYNIEITNFDVHTHEFNVQNGTIVLPEKWRQQADQVFVVFKHKEHTYESIVEDFERGAEGETFEFDIPVIVKNGYINVGAYATQFYVDPTDPEDVRRVKRIFNTDLKEAEVKQGSSDYIKNQPSPNTYEKLRALIESKTAGLTPGEIKEKLKELDNIPSGLQNVFGRHSSQSTDKKEAKIEDIEDIIDWYFGYGTPPTGYAPKHPEMQNHIPTGGDDGAYLVKDGTSDYALKWVAMHPITQAYFFVNIRRGSEPSDPWVFEDDWSYEKIKEKYLEEYMIPILSTHIGESTDIFTYFPTYFSSEENQFRFGRFVDDFTYEEFIITTVTTERQKAIIYNKRAFEDLSKKVENITDDIKGDKDKYTSVKAVVDYVDGHQPTLDFSKVEHLKTGRVVYNEDNKEYYIGLGEEVQISETSSEWKPATVQNGTGQPIPFDEFKFKLKDGMTIPFKAIKLGVKPGTEESPQYFLRFYEDTECTTEYTGVQAAPFNDILPKGGELVYEASGQAKLKLKVKVGENLVDIPDFDLISLQEPMTSAQLNEILSSFPWQS